MRVEAPRSNGTTLEWGHGVHDASEALRRAVKHLESLREADGRWEAEMVWNTMLLSQYVIVRRVCNAFPLPARERAQIIRHFEVTQRADGSWPMHRESPGYMFFTCLAYVSLRLLDVAPDSALLTRARAFLHAGDVRRIPTWGKFWLSLLGLYEYEGVNPISPELFLLPRGAPLHPNQIYCHTRYTYMAMSYLYGARFRAELGPLCAALRDELYALPYESIDFAAHRQDIAPSDLHAAPGRGTKLTVELLRQYEQRRSSRLRDKALARCLRRIEYEQRASRFRSLSPVTGLLNCLVLFAADPHHPLLERSLQAMETWKWDDEEEGTRLCGARSAAWDSALALRALMEAWQVTGGGSREAICEGYQWLTRAQLREDLEGREEEARESIVGGYCFSAGDERWPVSDCTAESLTTLLMVHDTDLAPDTAERFSDRAAREAVEFILSRQNRSGGFGTYESVRAPVDLNPFNPSEMYGDCMSERDFTECTCSCILALVQFRRSSVTASHSLRERVDAALARAVQALSKQQLSDGSFEGTWGINFIFGTYHAIDALIAAGLPASDARIARAASWLLSKQKADGGWGEHWTSSTRGVYVEHPTTQVVMTSWAVLGLLPVVGATHPAVQRGVAAIQRLQQADGSWPREAQAGVFFVTCVLDYPYYRSYFPTLALARYAKRLRTAEYPSSGRPPEVFSR